jgi:hypothetical protein
MNNLDKIIKDLTEALDESLIKLGKLSIDDNNEQARTLLNKIYDLMSDECFKRSSDDDNDLEHIQDSYYTSDCEYQE